MRLLRTTDLPKHALIAGLLASMCSALVHGLLDNFYFVADLAMVFWLQLAVVELLMHEQRETESPSAAVLERSSCALQTCEVL